MQEALHKNTHREWTELPALGVLQEQDVQARWELRQDAQVVGHYSHVTKGL